jgi:tetratricopeptide (TPR) repeat protein
VDKKRAAPLQFINMHSSIKIVPLIILPLAFLWQPYLATGQEHSGKPSWTALMVGGNSGDGAASFLAAARSVEAFGAEDPRLHVALRNAAHSYCYSNPALAESLFKRDISNLKKIDVNFPEIVYDCSELAEIYTRAGKYSESDAMIEESLRIRKKWQDFSSNDPYTAALYGVLYVNACMQGKTAAADVARSQMGSTVQWLRNPTRRGDCLTKLQAYFYNNALFCREHRLPQTQAFFEMSLDCSVRATSCYKKVGMLSDYVDQLYSSAEIAMALGESDKAEPFLRTALAAGESNFDLFRSNGWPGTCLLCKILFAQRRYQEARQLQEKYLSHLTQHLSTSSPFYQKARNICADFWYKNGRPDVAKSISGEAGQGRRTVPKRQ